MKTLIIESIKSRFRVPLALFVVVLLVLTTSTANAQVLTFDIQGTVQQNDLGLFGGRPVGDVFTGSFTIDPDAAQTADYGTAADYDGSTFDLTLEGESYAISVFNVWSVNSDGVELDTSNGTQIGTLSLRSSSDILSTNAVPTSYNLADFDQIARVSFFDFQSYEFSIGVITNITLRVPNQDPVAHAGENVVADCMGALTPVSLDGSLSSDPDGDALEFEWSVPIGSGALLDDKTSVAPNGLFPFGPTLVTLTVTDGNGGIDVTDVLVAVEDTSPPALVCTTDRIALWPPRHQMEDVWICIAVSDDCSSSADLSIICTVSSNEPDNANGDGSTTGDIDGHDGFASPVPINNLVFDEDSHCFYGFVALRAERDGSDEGRVYSIVCDVEDESGNLSTASCVVVVPHDKRKNK